MTIEGVTQTVAKIAEALAEPNTALLRAVVELVGLERAQEFLTLTLETEAAGGLLIQSGKRRRTPGGVFFYIVYNRLPKPERRHLWPKNKPNFKRQAGPGEAGSRKQARPAPAPAMAWADAMALLSTINLAGEARTVKITLIGRPLQITKQAECVVVALKGKEPAALPRGLPAPPANSAITWVVFIANKQWAKAGPALEADPEDKLLIDGYPLIDPKSGRGVVLALSCKTLKTERAPK